MVNKILDGIFFRRQTENKNIFSQINYRYEVTVWWNNGEMASGLAGEKEQMIF